ncbi:MAG: hypothetical protein WC006_06585 [Bacilli bacterium]
MYKIVHNSYNIELKGPSLRSNENNNLEEKENYKLTQHNCSLVW